MHSNVKVEFLRKCVRQQRYPIHLCGSLLDIMYRKKSMGNPLIPDAEKHFAAVLLSEFRNRYVKANINLLLIKIILNISLKLIL